MTFDQDPRRNPRPNQRSASFGSSNVIPLIVAAALAILLIAMMFPRTTPERAGDTNTGPSVQTVTPSPSPTTEPRPTQAPQP